MAELGREGIRTLIHMEEQREGLFDLLTLEASLSELSYC